MSKLPFLTLSVSAVILVSQLSACAPIAIGGAAATTAAVATDRRTAGKQVDDKTIKVKVGSRAKDILGDEPGRVSANSYNGQVLLVGDVPSEDISQRIAHDTEKVDSVKSVVNRIRVGEPTMLSVRTNDSWITAKTTTALINAKEVPSRTISVTTERGIVYLQGLVTKDEGERAAKTASRVPGVNQVVKVFEYISAEKALLHTQNQDTEKTPEKESQNTTKAQPSDSYEPEVFKIE